MWRLPKHMTQGIKRYHFLFFGTFARKLDSGSYHQQFLKMVQKCWAKIICHSGRLVAYCRLLSPFGGFVSVFVSCCFSAKNCQMTAKRRQIQFLAPFASKLHYEHDDNLEQWGPFGSHFHLSFVPLLSPLWQ